MERGEGGSLPSTDVTPVRSRGFEGASIYAETLQKRHFVELCE